MSGRLSHAMLLLIGLGLALVPVAYLSRHYFPPAAIATGYLCIACLVYVRRHERARFFVYNVSFVFLSFFIAEVALYVANFNAGRDDFYPLGHWQDERELGYTLAPVERTAQITRMTRSGQTIYKAKYGIDGHGFRKTANQSGRPIVWFFGCSFTFGEGLNDADTFPQQFSLASEFAALNFGVGGYGPHQVLRMLEIGRPLVKTKEQPIAIMYTLLPEHVQRAAGRSFWDQFGPKYEVVDGKATYVGPFKQYDEKAWNRTLWDRIRRNSEVLKVLFRKGETEASQADRERLVAIVKRIGEISQQRYGARFAVVLWDVRRGNKPTALDDWLAGQLEASNIPLLRLSKATPAVQGKEYYIAHDGHPNGKANALVGQALAPFIAQLVRGREKM